MWRFTQLFHDLDETARPADRQRRLERYFNEAPPEDAAWALWILWGNRFRTGISSKRLQQWAVELSGCPDWLAAACQDQVGDLAEAASLLIPLSGRSGPELPLHEVIETRVLPLRYWDDRFQLQILREFWLSLRREEALVLSKMLTGVIRIGASRPMLLRALANCLACDPEVLAHRLTRKWEPTAAFFRSLSTQPDGPEVHISPSLALLLEDLADDRRVQGNAAPQCTADLVLVYAQTGHGSRSSLFTQYTLAARDGDKLVPVAKVDSDLDELELREIDGWIKENAIAKRGPVRTVPAELVFEIGYEGMRLSRRHKAGLILRSPRILAWRRDITVDAITPLEIIQRPTD
ncbi:MAG TPA: hypothetical protein VK995_01970 [Oceanipulchritudo sp.]|nr:hypothetical protein [Oceanipulchritudo sp.]